MNLSLLPLYRFWMQIIVSIAVLVFCGVGIVSKDRLNGSFYSNLFYLVLGNLLPSPGGSGKKEGDQVAIESEQTNVFPEIKNQDKN